ncbi:cell adhesion molecule 4-like [Rhipicephalus microplus]|uniref:cell adhesion molecule 4-like n=1 Tax=Rhipicephalus microplus TaxID=6941 RepID=UPI003F6C45B0
MKLRCTASRPVAGAASVAVTLDVFLAPVQALLVRRGPLVAGVTAELECVAWGSRPEPTLRWTLGGRPMASAFSHWDGRNVSTATVTLRPAPADHGRRLICAASNPKTPAIPSVQDSRRLDVHYPPEMQLETCSAAAGWACLHCRVAANPPPLRLTWTRDGEAMRDVPPLSAVLRWRQRQGRLEHYACAAENPLGAGSSRPVGLILLEKQGKATMSTPLAAALLLLLALLLLFVAFFCILAWNRRRLWLRGLCGRARGPQRGEVLRAASCSGASASCEHAEAHKPA